MRELAISAFVLFLLTFSFSEISSQGLSDIEMIYIEGGNFTMGCTHEQTLFCEIEEIPSFDIEVKSFYLSKTEVTQAQWVELMGALPDALSDFNEDFPISHISWYDALVFCNKLSILQNLDPVYYTNEDLQSVLGYDGENWELVSEDNVFIDQNAAGYRLPNEVQWEFAARGGLISQEYIYSGTNITSELYPFQNAIVSVNQGKGNELGLLGMSGNVKEWTESTFSPYPLANQVDSLYRVKTENNVVVKGGSSFDDPKLLRVSSRAIYEPINYSGSLGFRILRYLSSPLPGNALALDCNAFQVLTNPITGIFFELSGIISYSGGNGGTYSSQHIESSGVGGLFLTIEAGNFRIGNGSVLVGISGMPTEAGIAEFVIEIGGQICTLSIQIDAMPGSINSLNCSNIQVTAQVIENQLITNVSGQISYEGGNGGFYDGGSYTSMGVEGINLSFSSGQFNIGAGIILFQLSGTPQSHGIASFLIELGGVNCTLEIIVEEGSSWPPNYVHCDPDNPTVVAEVMNPTTGRIWMDRNLGASRVALSSTDENAYGDLYQWGRGADGHQCRDSEWTIVTSNEDIPGHSDFIAVNLAPLDWRTPQNNALWQGIEGVNNPCPGGFRVPTSVELEGELATWNQQNSIGAFNSVLRLVVGGARANNSALVEVGNRGAYWSSTIFTVESRNLAFLSNTAGMIFNPRVTGFSVRCIKDESSGVGMIESLNCDEVMLSGNLIKNQESSNVEFSINYSGGNGRNYGAQSIPSSGVTGLIAHLPSGSFSNGSGTLIYSISGTPLEKGTAFFNITVGGQNCIVPLSIEEGEDDSSWPPNYVHCDPDNPTVVVEVLNPATGRVWMDRNLGARRVSQSSTDSEAFGDLYQWGRASDGHQCRNSATISSLSGTNQPVHSNFITVNSLPKDWRNPQNNNLWQGVNGINNPCPIGYRLPTHTEFNTERLSWNFLNADGALASPLKIPLSGFRSSDDGSLTFVNVAGHYWSSSISSTDAIYLFILNNNANVTANPRAYGRSVRCIKDEDSVMGSIESLNCTQVDVFGVLIEDQAVSDVGFQIVYAGGNGGAYDAQNINSSGVTGLTAQLTGGTFSNGSGSLNFSVSGTPLGSGIVFFNITVGGQNCIVELESVAMNNCGDPTVVREVMNPQTGRIWMDRNLGASRAATNRDDELAFGDLYQWGRGSDGHQCRNSNTTFSKSNSNNPGHSFFITSFVGQDDWRTSPNSNLWQGTTGVNNPCPEGYRIPRDAEWQAENLTWASNNGYGAFNSPLRLARGGFRFINGTIDRTSSWGQYWSSTTVIFPQSHSRNLKFHETNAFIGADARVMGMSVRCIKD